MNEVLMSIYLKHHSMPYAIHEMRRHPRNVRFEFFSLSIRRKFWVFVQRKEKREGKKKQKKFSK